MPSATLVLRWCATLAIGVAGGSAAVAIGAPLPWLLGAMMATAAATLAGLQPLGGPLVFPTTLRLLFIPVIGVLIGGAFTPEVLRAMPGWWPGLLAVSLFVPLAHAMNYLIFRRLGRVAPPEAYFGAMPGGLIESIELARDSGADVAVVSVLQFARIAVTVTAVPLIFAAMEGRAVGSAAGQTLSGAALPGLLDAAVLIGCGWAGFVAAVRARVPAGQIVGPIVFSAAAHALGFTSASPPAFLVSVAQLVIGVTLGLRFKGLEPRLLGRYLGLSALSVVAMLGLGVLLALPVAAAGVSSVAIMVLSMAPGGVVEMGLIALSLNASPIFVTAHHLVRIVLTVLVAVGGWRLLRRQMEGRDPPR
jgi:membrane AbrB-like protein